MTVKAKICGLKTDVALHTAVANGAAYVGFVFYDKSPRNVTIDKAVELAEIARCSDVGVVAVVVDPDLFLLQDIAGRLQPDLIQLHGRETPAQVAEFKGFTCTPVIRAFRVSDPTDLDISPAYEVADYFMFDAKPPADTTLPGGNGAAFDWAMLAGRRFARPWFLAGGLTPDNVAEAVRVSGAPMVDVSSGVESAPGVKDPALIEAFLKAVSRA